jgi:hypothetical protein
MDSKQYVSVLKENLIPEMRMAKRSIPSTWRLMQDNAPCHTSKVVKAFLTRNSVEFID